MICANDSSLFEEQTDATRKQTICPKVKLLYCLKLLAYGCSPYDFQDLFQIGLMMIHKAFLEFARMITSSENWKHFVITIFGFGMLLSAFLAH